MERIVDVEKVLMNEIDNLHGVYLYLEGDSWCAYERSAYYLARLNVPVILQKEVIREGYDVVFMDAAKGQYIHFLPDILRLLPPGGLLISDNVLQDGDIIESRFAVTRRNRTIHARMREYLYELKHHPELETVILPVGDGVTLSTKKEESTVTQNR